MRPNSRRMATAVDRKYLLANMALIRNLFSLTGFDVTRYSDKVIADTMLAVCPTSGPDWPSDAQLRTVFDRLVAGDGPK